jgi:hypothetical protein
LFGASCYSCISILSSLLPLGLIYNSLPLMCTILQPLFKWVASFGWRWQDLCLLNKQRHNAFHTAKHCIHGTRMPNIDNDNSTRVLSQKLRKVTIYIRSIKSLWNRGWRMVHIRGRLLYISPKGKDLVIFNQTMQLIWSINKELQLDDINKYLLVFPLKAKHLLQHQLTSKTREQVWTIIRVCNINISSCLLISHRNRWLVFDVSLCMVRGMTRP